MKHLNFIFLFLFTILISFKVYSYDVRDSSEILGRSGPPPAGSYKLGVKELERAIKTEKKGKFKKAKIKYEKALEYLLEANAEDPANPDILNYLGLCSTKLGFDENAEIYYLLGLELNDQHNSIKYNLGVFYKNQNRISDMKEILNSLKNCSCKEYENLKMLIN